MKLRTTTFPRIDRKRHGAFFWSVKVNVEANFVSMYFTLMSSVGDRDAEETPGSFGVALRDRADVVVVVATGDADWPTLPK
jgi:hypothetical protein